MKNLEKELEIIQKLDNDISDATKKYVDKFEKFGDSIKNDVIKRIKDLIPNAIEVGYHFDHDPESARWKTLHFFICLDGESEFMIKDDDKYFAILFNDDLIGKLNEEIKSSFHISFRGNRKGDGKKLR